MIFMKPTLNIIFQRLWVFFSCILFEIQTWLWLWMTVKRMFQTLSENEKELHRQDRNERYNYELKYKKRGDRKGRKRIGRYEKRMETEMEKEISIFDEEELMIRLQWTNSRTDYKK